MNKTGTNKLQSPVVVGYARTPIGDMMGGLSTLSAVELGVIAVNGALNRAGIQSASVDEVVCGMVYKSAVKGNPARQISLKVNCPETATASTIDQQCASGMRAFEMVCQSIMLDKSEIGIAVGIESMSNVPHLLIGSRNGFRMGDVTIKDALLYDALHDAQLNYHMGITAENLADMYSISRLEQDELALLSHQRASRAAKAGIFAQEIIPVEIKARKGTIVVNSDEHPKEDITIDQLAKLRPAFKENGTVTAGNSSSLNDGAAAVIMMSEEKALEMGIKPICRVLSTASIGVKPEIMGIGPVYAIPKALSFAKLNMENIDYFEINEAFAAQFIAVNRELKLNMDKVNINGSGISIGHPVGCTGTRIIISLIQELKRRETQLGVASLCVGGGPAMATILEMQ